MYNKDIKLDRENTVVEFKLDFTFKIYRLLMKMTVRSASASEKE